MATGPVVKSILSFLCLGFLGISFTVAAPPHKHIAVTQFVEHVAADTVRQGLLEELAKRGYKEGENLMLTFANAQGNAATAGQIARKFVSLNPDVIIAITTPSAQAVLKAADKTALPIVFSAVTSPEALNLASDSKGKVTGVTDAPPIKEQMAFIHTLLPDAKKVGILYNPGDSGSAASLKTIYEEAKRQGFKIIESPLVRTSDIQGAILQLVGKVDAIYIPLDNMLVSAMEVVASMALKHDLPLFSADSGSVEAGAFACYGYSYRQVGLKTGEMVGEILEGKDASQIPIASPDKLDIFINRQALEKLKIRLPAVVRTQAHFY